MFVALSSMQVTINDVVINISSGSGAYDLGEGTRNVTGTDKGNGRSESVHTIDTSTKVGMYKCEVFNTPEINQLIRDWKTATAGNKIDLEQFISGQVFSIVFQGMSCVDPVERPVSPDGTVALLFKGDAGIMSLT